MRFELASLASLAFLSGPSMANQKSVSDLMGMIAGFAEGASDVLPAAAPAGGAAASASATAAVGAARMDAVSARLRSTVRSRKPRLS